MDGRRAIGGFCTFCGGLVVNIIQATKPDWFGNHSWILPGSFVVLFVGLLLWLCQYSWAQRLLGIETLEIGRSDSAPAPATPEPSIQESAKAFAQEENYKAYVRIGIQCENLFSPLQMEILQLAKDLTNLLKASPLPKKTDYGYNPQRQKFGTTDQIHAWGDANFAAEQKIRAQYALRFQSKAVALYHQLVVEASIDDRNLEALAKGECKTGDIENLVAALRKVVFTLEDSRP